ncbi:histidine-specific methyltransferase [Diplogelasinospora grovesii]|uniref:Histidine-specific methyltransferase n=1 Tax=Diplogelasinospora grovesii TaxID=303347 RepID=A0AAN6N2Y6_9PEZI|nr:histidine-specific methyltransferase [Diplogelasinospora grovesii]
MVVRIASPRSYTDGYLPSKSRKFLNGDTLGVVSPTHQQASALSIPVQPTPPSATGIIDIRSSTASLLDSLDTMTLEGLRQPYGAKTMPSLLLWDEKGQDLYNEILASNQYYPYRVENELLKQRIDEIASTVASSSTDMVVELGAGNMTKTSLFLAALDKQLDTPLVYYALDVDQAQLESSIKTLKERTSLTFIEVRGLLGTYADGARWLSRPESGMRHLRKTMVWLGNSIANYLQHEAGEVLGSFAHDPEDGSPQNLAGFLLAVDGCQDAQLISHAYDVPTGQTRRWVRYGLEAAKRHLNDPEAERLLRDDNWRFMGRWEPERQRYENYFVATKDLNATIRGEEIHLKEGERVQILGSGKWTKSEVSRICSRQGLVVNEWWNSVELDYGVYWLQSSLRRKESGIAMDI